MELELKGYLRILVKRVWFIGLVLVLFCGAAAAQHLLYSKPVYEAGTKMVINSAGRTDGTVSPDYNAVNVSLLLLDTYKEIIGTPAILGQVVSRHPEYGLTPKKLASKISVSTSEKSQVIGIFVRDYSAARAASIANAVAEIFKEEIPRIMSVDNVTILSQASPSDNPGPVSKGLAYKLVVAFILGLAASVGFVFLWEYWDDSIRTDDDIARYLEKPTLAVIRHMGKAEIRHSRKLHKKRSADAAPVGVNQQA